MLSCPDNADIVRVPGAGHRVGNDVIMHNGTRIAYGTYGTDDTEGIQLAIKHIEALGGPTINLSAIDSGSGDASKGTTLARQLGGNGVPTLLTSLGADAGSEIPYFKDYMMTGYEAGVSLGGVE